MYIHHIGVPNNPVLIYIYIYMSETQIAVLAFMFTHPSIHGNVELALMNLHVSFYFLSILNFKNVNLLRDSNDNCEASAVLVSLSTFFKFGCTAFMSLWCSSAYTFFEWLSARHKNFSPVEIFFRNTCLAMKRDEEGHNRAKMLWKVLCDNLWFAFHHFNSLDAMQTTSHRCQSRPV